MRILVSGTRYAVPEHAKYIREWLTHYADGDIICGVPTAEIVVVHGAAPGVDKLSEVVAQGEGFRTEAHAANWGVHGKGAGPIRNQEMVDLGASLVVAFPAIGSKGKGGTWDLIHRAVDAGLEVHIHPLKAG
jgi:hypothetical protein